MVAGRSNAKDSAGTNHGQLLMEQPPTRREWSAWPFVSTERTTVQIAMPPASAHNVSVEAWVKFTSLDTEGSSSDGQQFLVFKKNSRMTDFEGFNLSKDRRTAGDYLLFGVTSANGVAFEADSVSLVTTGVWYQVVEFVGRISCRFMLTACWRAACGQSAQVMAIARCFSAARRE